MAEELDEGEGEFSLPSAAALTYGLHLSQLRSSFLVMQALVTRFPTEAEWDAFISSPQFEEGADSLQQVLQDIQEEATAGGAEHTLDNTMLASVHHSVRAIEAIEDLCETLDVDPMALLSTLMQTP